MFVTLHKKIRLITCLLVLSILCSLSFAAPENLDGIAAIVNDHVITSAALQKQLAMAKHQAAAQHLQLPSQATLREQVLNHMIDTNLQLAMAEKAGIKVNDAEVNHSIKVIASHNHFSPSKLRQEVEKSGLSFSAYKKSLRKQIILDKLQHSAVAAQVVVTPSEVKNALAELPAVQDPLQYHINHLLIPIPADATKAQIAATKKKAQQIDAKLRKGMSFRTIAHQELANTDAANNIDWDWQKASDLPVVFTTALSNMTTGQISSPIETGNGFHIIKLVAQRDQGTPQVVTEYHVRHILIAVNKNETRASALARINALRKDIVNGNKFSTIAKKYSQDPGSKTHGGDLGWVTLNSLTPKFADALPTLKKDQLSKPVLSKFGWHLIEVLGTKQVNVANHMREMQAQQMVFERKYNTAVKHWLAKLRKSAYIKVMPTQS